MGNEHICDRCHDLESFTTFSKSVQGTLERLVLVRLLFHKNDYSEEFIDTNYYKQNRMTTLNYT